MSDQPRYQTLRDYLRVVRAQRWLILLIVVAFTGAAVAYSVRQDPEYEAEASLAFNELTLQLGLVGVQQSPTEGPQQRSAIAAERVTRPEVAQRVREALNIRTSIDALQDAVSARAEAQTNLVIIQARGGDADFAARLANEFARQARAVDTAEEFAQLRAAERSIRRSLREAEREGDRSSLAIPTFTDRLSRIQALLDFGEPVEISKQAEVPESPVSPNPVRNTILGLLLGLTLALLVAFVRDSLDVRLRGSREIQAEVKLPLVGHVGDEAMGRAAVSSNGHGKLSAADLESFRILRRNLEFLDIDSPLRSIAVTSALPEEGKSTVAAALAWACAQNGKSTLLVECDLRRPSLAQRLGLEQTPGLSDYLTGQVGPQEVLQPLPAALSSSDTGNGNGDRSVHGATDLVVITAGSPVPRPSDVFASQRFRDFLAQVRDAYDVVVLDTSPLLSVSDTLELLPHVDGTVLCVRAGQTRREEVKAAKSALDHMPERPTGLVVTGIKSGEEVDYGYYSATHTYGAA